MNKNTPTPYLLFRAKEIAEALPAPEDPKKCKVKSIHPRLPGQVLKHASGAYVIGFGGGIDLKVNGQDFQAIKIR